jgi:protein phosphatase 1 regulatory subunit 10
VSIVLSHSPAHVSQILTFLCTAPTSTSAGASTSSFFAQPFYFSPTAAPYNAMAYGTWASGPSTVPLSKYSSLNGATSTSGTSVLQSQQPMQPPPQHPQDMMIECVSLHWPTTRNDPLTLRLASPALTTLNGSTSNDISQHYTQPSPFSQQSPHSQSQPTTFRYHNLHQPSLSINPTLVHSSHYFSLQPPAQPQGTLSPHALHSPSSPTLLDGSPSQIFSQAPAVDAEARKAQFQASIRPMLLPNAFSGAGAVHSLVSQIVEYGSAEVDAPTRLDILTRIRDNAGNHYFRAWVENPTAIDITREWLKAAFTAKSDNPLVETVMPLLHVSLAPSGTALV